MISLNDWIRENTLLTELQDRNFSNTPNELENLVLQLKTFSEIEEPKRLKMKKDIESKIEDKQEVQQLVLFVN